MHEINGIQYTTDELMELMTELVTRAMDAAPTRGDNSEIGLVYTFAEEHHWLSYGH